MSPDCPYPTIGQEPIQALGEGQAKWRPFARSAINPKPSALATNTAAIARRSTKFAWAPMGFTIARIVARLATCGWQNPMTSDPVRTELIVPDDPRLIPAVGTVVAHAAERAGLAHPVQKGFAAAAIEACREQLSLIHKGSNTDSRVRVSVVDFPDRVEVWVENIGETPQSESPEPFRGPQQYAMVDRVVHETHSGRVRTTLIKYCGAHAPAPKD